MYYFHIKIAGVMLRHLQFGKANEIKPRRLRNFSKIGIRVCQKKLNISGVPTIQFFYKKFKKYVQ